jgi:hypothetical protein
MNPHVATPVTPSYIGSATAGATERLICCSARVVPRLLEGVPIDCGVCHPAGSEDRCSAFSDR